MLLKRKGEENRNKEEGCDGKYLRKVGVGEDDMKDKINWKCKTRVTLNDNKVF